MSDNGYIKKEIINMLRKTKAHTWTAYITPITEKFYIEADCSFSEFIESISEYNVTKELWDFHQNKKPEIHDE